MPRTIPSRPSLAPASFAAAEPKNSCLRTPLSALLGIVTGARRMQLARKRSSRHNARRVSKLWSIELTGTMLISLIGGYGFRGRGKHRLRTEGAGMIIGIGIDLAEVERF